MKRLTVTSTEFDDGYPGFIAHCLDVPEFVGHGDDHDEAVDDFMDQFGDRVLH